MAVLVARVVSVLQPFLQLVVLPYVHRRQLADGVAQAVGEGFVARVHHVEGGESLRQRVEDNLVIHGAARGDGCSRAFRTVFGRH